MIRLRTPSLLALMCLLAPLHGCAPGEDADEEAPAAAAPPPSVDIWIAGLQAGPEGLALQEPENLTRRFGYENQPHFLDDGTLLYTREEDGDTDIWRWTPEMNTHAPLTRTSPESEYSAARIPGTDQISVIRVEADSTQRLWRFGLDGSPVAPIFPDVAPVGYHAWVNGDEAYLFVLGNPATLHYARVGESGSEERARDIGRSLQPVPNRVAVSYVQRMEGGTEIRIASPGEADSELFAPGIGGGDDHAWTPDGHLLQAEGNVLYRTSGGGADAAWIEVGRLPEGHVISRLAVSTDGIRIALVVAAPS